MVISVEPSDFWAQIVQLTAVLALALVIEVRAVYRSAQAVDKSRTKYPRFVMALAYLAAVVALAFTFVTSLSGMTGATVSDEAAEIIVWALILTFVLLVVAPVHPLIWALIEDMPFSPGGLERRRLSRFRVRVYQAFQEVDRAERAARLIAMAEACAQVVEASQSEAKGTADGGSRLDAALERFESSRLPRRELVAARHEVEALVRVLEEGSELTNQEVRRWRAASRVIRAAGGHSIP